MPHPLCDHSAKVFATKCSDPRKFSPSTAIRGSGRLGPVPAHAPTTPKNLWLRSVGLYCGCFRPPVPRVRGDVEGEKRTVVCGTPGFLGVVGACACNSYQALFPPPSGPGYEASSWLVRGYMIWEIVRTELGGGQTEECKWFTCEHMIHTVNYTLVHRSHNNPYLSSFHACTILLW